MAKCSRCGKKFDIDFDRDEFELSTGKNYDNLTKRLCAKCAIEAVDDMEEGIYVEICENCGCEFDPFEAEVEFNDIHSDDSGADISMFGRVLCLDCANEEYENS